MSFNDEDELDHSESEQSDDEYLPEELESCADGIMFLFKVGDNVLARWRNGLGYESVIEKIDVSEHKLHVRFEDNTRSAAEVKDVRFDGKKWRIANCVVCLLRRALRKHMPEDDDKAAEPLYKCSDCGWRYHESCHSPMLRSETLEQLGGPESFYCHTCTFIRATNYVNNERQKLLTKALSKDNTNLFFSFELVKRELPYRMEDLLWNESHTANEQSSYCYCGGPGKWSDHMFQCGSCRQWFHEYCVRASVTIGSKLKNRDYFDVPEMLLFDSYYQFTCALCSEDGQETVERHPAAWSEILSICLLNLSEGKPKLSIKSKVIPWLKARASSFVVDKGESPVPITDNEWIELVQQTASAARGRFLTSANGKTSSPQSSQWVQLKQRTLPPRKLSDSVSGGTFWSSATQQRLMRCRLPKKSIDGSSMSEEVNSASTTSQSTSVLPSKKSSKRRDSATEKVLSKMENVAEMLGRSQDVKRPKVTGDNIFQLLMPSLYAKSKQGSPDSRKRKLTQHLPPGQSQYTVFKLGNQPEYTVFHSLEVDVGSTSSSFSSLTPPLVGAKKRKAYLPRQTESSRGSDGQNSVRCSVSPYEA